MMRVLENAVKRHADIVSNLNNCFVDIVEAGMLLQTALFLGKKILICGNGGSAADSQHFAAELVCKYKDSRNPYPAIALTTDSSIMTAIGNDYGFNEVFARQIAAIGNEGDVLVVLTTSGESLNIKKAIEIAKLKKIRIIMLTGQKGVGWKNEQAIDRVIVIPSQETARIQEMHELIYHAWCEGFDQTLGVE
jgi:D-sedoheptulose 7-phosphate isomerase